MQSSRVAAYVRDPFAEPGRGYEFSEGIAGTQFVGFDPDLYAQHD